MNGDAMVKTSGAQFYNINTTLFVQRKWYAHELLLRYTKDSLHFAKGVFQGVYIAGGLWSDIIGKLLRPKSKPFSAQIFRH
jgi:hypothetical protein